LSVFNSDSTYHRAPDKVHIFISIMPISSLNPMIDYLLESSYLDDSNKWSIIGFGEALCQVLSIEVNFTHLIWRFYSLPCTCIYNILPQRPRCTISHAERWNFHSL